MLACLPNLIVYSLSRPGKSLLLQAISQHLSKNSWMQVSHSSSFTVQLLTQWLLTSELLLKEHLRAVQLESILVTPRSCAETCFSSPWLVLAHLGSAQYCSYVCYPLHSNLTCYELLKYLLFLGSCKRIVELLTGLGCWHVRGSCIPC